MTELSNPPNRLSPHPDVQDNLSEWDVEQLLMWMGNPHRLPAHTAFTASGKRIMAAEIEMLLQQQTTSDREVADMKHDLERLMATNAELLNENEELRQRQSEISVNLDLLKAAIGHDIDAIVSASPDAIEQAADSVMGTLKPFLAKQFLAKHKPMFISLKALVPILQKEASVECDGEILNPEEVLKAVLDTAGVKYE